MRRRALFMAGLFLAVALLMPAGAGAGRVTIHQCHAREGSNSMLGNWGAGVSTRVFGWCAPGAGWLSLQAASDGAGTLGAGDVAQVDITAPLNTSIVEGKLHRQIVNYAYLKASGGSPPSLDSWALGYRLGDPANGGGYDIERCGTLQDSIGSCRPREGDPSWTSDFPNPDVHFATAAGSGKRSVRIAFGCFATTSGTANGCHPGLAYPRVDVGLIELVVEDNSSPIADIRGPLWDDLLVTEPVITIDAADSGLGVLDATVVVDGKPIQDVAVGGGSCTYPDHVFDRADVCPTDPGALSLTVPHLPEGRHRVAVQLRDLSLNTVVIQRRTTAEIDVVPPPVPGTGEDRPFVSGSVREGGTLTANPGNWNSYGREIAFTYQWQRCAKDGGGCLDIAGATSQRYTPGALDLNALIRATISGTIAGDPEDATAATTDTVGPVVGLQCFGARCEVVTVADENGGDSQPPPNGAGASARARVTAAYGNKRIVRMRYGQRVVLTGRVGDERGGAISGAKLDVLSRSGALGAPYSPIGQVTTAPDGTFKYLTTVGASRVIRFAYRAVETDLEYASAADVELIVQARVAFRATKRVRAGQPLRLTGSVASIRPGTRLEIQARDGRVWRTFKTVRTRKDGSFATSYTFKRVPRPLSYLFRVVYRKNPAVALESARSRAVRVNVRP